MIDPEPYVTDISRSIKTLTHEEVKQSIQRELTWLLNTTCSFSQEQMEKEERSTLNYGIHDFSNFFPDSSDNRTRLSSMIKSIVESFEPRLADVEVEIKKMTSRNDQFSLSLIIEAGLIIDRITEPVTFIMAID